jgi:predicted GIY-YIG superfamily endonuclease
MPKPKLKIAKKPKKKRAPAKGPFLVYALRHTHQIHRSYTGQTNDFLRRIRQHNGKISGGARYTRIAKKESSGSGSWEPIFHVTGFQTIRSVLQFEIAMKKRKVPTRFQPGAPSVGGPSIDKQYTRGPSGRVRQLEYLLSLGRLNEETHSPFAQNGIGVTVHLTKEEYLRLGRMTDAQFAAARAQQPGIHFKFHC